MLFLTLVIGVGLSAVSWAQSEGTLRINGRDYAGDCTMKRVNLVHPDCPRSCPGNLEICAIRGVPYANASRFEKPQPVNSTVRETLEWKNGRVHCAQIDPFSGVVVGHEDCLVVDFYFPKAWDRVPENNRRLVVLLEGVNFESSLAGYLQATQGLASENYMLAVIHYRTGVFGFMTLEDQLAPPNLGLWDQQMALQFLQNEASSLKLKSKDDFVVLGFGAGAIALHLHMLNPVSSKLFKRVLLSGGNALSPGATTPNALNTTLTLAKRLECGSGSRDAIMQCLRRKPVKDILEQVNTEPVLRFATVVDADLVGATPEDAFITAPINDLLRSHDINKMEAVIHGYPAFAGLNHYLRNKGKASKDGDIGYLSRFFTMYGETTAKSVAESVYNRLFQKAGVEEVVNADPKDFIDSLTDFLVGSPIQTLVLNQLRQRTEPPTVALDFYVMYHSSTRTAEGTAPSLASYLNKVKDDFAGLPATVPRESNALDDMLLFVGCDGVQYTEPAGEFYKTAESVKPQAEMANDLIKCLFDPQAECGTSTLELKPTGEFPFGGQRKARGVSIADPYRYSQNQLWTSTISLASAMSDVEVQKWVLAEMNGDLRAVNAAGSSQLGMIVGLVVLAVLTVALIIVVAKLVVDRRRANAMTTVEKPARSGAHYNTAMDTVTVEEGNRM